MGVKLRVIATVILFSMVLLAGCGGKTEQKDVLPTVTPTMAAEKTEDPVPEENKNGLATQVAVRVGEFDMTMDHMMVFLYAIEKDGAAVEHYYSTLLGSSFWDMQAGEEGRTMRDAYKDSVMEEAIRYGILYQEAKKQGITLTEEELSQSEAYAKDFMSQCSETELQRGGFTYDAVKKTSELMLLADKYYNSLVDGLSVDKEEISASMDREDYRQYVTEHLFLATSFYDANGEVVEQSDAEKAEGFAYMLTLLNRLLDGESMTEVQAGDTSTLLTHTECIFSGNTEELNQDYVAVAMNLANEEYSGIVETPQGYYVIRMINNESTAAYDTALEEAYQTALNDAFYEIYAALEENYSPVINEAVWGPLVMGEIVVDPVTE